MTWYLESQIIAIELKKNQMNFRSSSKVVGLGPTDLWEFPTLHDTAPF